MIHRIEILSQMTSNEAMTKKILVPLDGSSLSEKALMRAIDILKYREGSTLLALRVLELPEASPLFEPLDLESAKAKERREVNDYLDTIKEQLHLPGGHIETRAVRAEGNLAATIVKQAELEQVDMIALTTHGRTGFDRLFFGSVAEKVIRLAPCSVLIVR